MDHRDLKQYVEDYVHNDEARGALLDMLANLEEAPPEHLHLRLIFDVIFEDAIGQEADLRACLEQIVQHALNRGMVTNDSEAVVLHHSHMVQRVE